MTEVRFVDVPDSEMVRVSFRYDPELVSLVKQVSSSLRSYDGETKTWTVHESVAEQLVESIIAAGHSVGGAQAPPAEAPSSEPPSLDGFFDVNNNDTKAKDRAYVKAKAAEIVAGIPAQYAHRVFRAIGRELYPDLYDRRNR